MYGSLGAMSCMEQMYGPDGVESCMVVRCEVVYGPDCVESYMVVRCEVVYGTDGVESCMVHEVRCRVWKRCMDQMVSIRVWWWVAKSCIVQKGVESCMVVRCEVVYGTLVWNREYHAWNMWFQCCMKQEVTGNICKRKHRVQQFVIFP